MQTFGHDMMCIFSLSIYTCLQCSVQFFNEIVLVIITKWIHMNCKLSISYFTYLYKI